MKPSGYSGTPLGRKLGIKPGYKIKLIHEPEHYFDLFTDWPDDVQVINDETSLKNIIHYFTTSVQEFKQDILHLRKQMEQNGMIWISWPKKSSKVQTDINENLIRDMALENGLVDVKVCAIDENWSGLKLVIRLKDRS